MVRVITQDTYDEVVKENIEEFDMSPEEAISEAVAQFEAQGVDLSNIIKDLALSSGDNHLITKTINTVKDLCKNQVIDDVTLLKELRIIKEECDKDIAHRVRAGKDGAYTLLLDLLEAKINKHILEKNGDTLLISVLNTLSSLMDMQPDLLDEKGIKLMIRLIDVIDSEEINIATLKWINNCCLKHEMNRQNIFSMNIVDKLKVIVTTSKNSKQLSAALRLIRRLTLDDDVRMEFGKAHDHAKEMGAQMLVSLTNLMKEYSKAPIVTDIMSTISSLLVRHELCKLASDNGIGSILFTILAENYDNMGVIIEAVKLITALAGNDDVKRELVKSGIVPIIVSLLSRYSSNAQASGLILKCMAALSLREPGHSQQFLENGSPEVIVECMKIHQDNANVQKNACWAIRNMVARCRDHNTKFHELGIEGLLNDSYEKFNKEFGFDIKSALRDLECNVKLDEQWTGKGVQMDN